MVYTVFVSDIFSIRYIWVDYSPLLMKLQGMGISIQPPQGIAEAGLNDLNNRLPIGWIIQNDTEKESLNTILNRYWEKEFILTYRLKQQLQSLILALLIPSLAHSLKAKKWGNKSYCNHSSVNHIVFCY